MPLSWNEIKSRAIAFSKDWAGETSERAESQTFWNAFFHVFGIERRRVAAFEKQVSMARDAAVDTAYGRRNFTTDAERVAFLFGLYQRYTSLLPAEPARKTARRRRLAA